MRLIDADALLKRKGCAYDSEGHLLYAVGTGDIVHAPTIDAIPVEWIIKWSNKRYRVTQGDVSIVDVLEAWQREQEAR